MSSINVVSDLVCPWCYIGKRRLEAALEALPHGLRHSVSWHPFQLNPEMPRAGMSRKEYCMRKFGSWSRCQEMFETICEVGETVAIEFHFEKQPMIPNTLDAHRIIWLAREGPQDEVVEALFKAYFCEGIDLSQRSELIEVAVEVGLGRRELERMLDSDSGVAEVEAAEQEVKALGISSVPLFVIDGRVAVSGAQPPDTLVKAFEEAEAMRRRKPTVLTR